MEKQSLEERVEFLEQRVRYLEEKLLSDNEPVVVKTPPVTNTVSNVHHIQKEPVEWDVLIFQKILPRLFIFVLIIGVLWGFKAASDYGILTESVKVILGFIVAAVLLYLGHVQVNRERNVLGQVLIGGSIPVFMLTTFAMHQLYEMTGPEVTFILNLLWIALGLYLTLKYKSQGIGIVSAVGGLLIPFLIEGIEPNIVLFVSYETILYTLFTWLALQHRYIALYHVSAILLNIVLFFYFIITDIPDGYEWIVITPILIQQMTLLIGFLKTNYLGKVQAYTLFSSMILSAAWVTGVLSDNQSALTFGLISIIYGTCYYLYQKDQIRAPIFIANALMSILFFTQILYDEAMFEVIIGSSLLYMFVAKKYKSLFHSLLSAFTYLYSFTFIVNQYMEAWITWEMLHWIVFLAVTAVAINNLSKSSLPIMAKIYHVAIPYFALVTLIFSSRIATIIAGDAGDNTERMIVSIIWIGIAILFMYGSRALSIIQGKYVGVGILFITLAKIILIDIHFVSVVVRAFLFILLGVVGLIVSRAYYKK